MIHVQIEKDGAQKAFPHRQRATLRAVGHHVHDKRLGSRPVKNDNHSEFPLCLCPEPVLAKQ
jgi:hypothetical protein